MKSFPYSFCLFQTLKKLVPRKCEWIKLLYQAWLNSIARTCTTDKGHVKMQRQSYMDCQTHPTQKSYILKSLMAPGGLPVGDRDEIAGQRVTLQHKRAKRRQKTGYSWAMLRESGRPLQKGQMTINDVRSRIALVNPFAECATHSVHTWHHGGNLNASFKQLY